MNTRQHAGLAILSIALGWGAVEARADDATPTRQRTEAQTRDETRDRARTTVRDTAGAEQQLLSEEERNTYRERLQAAKSKAERRKVQNEHRELVRRRASERSGDVAEQPEHAEHHERVERTERAERHERAERPERPRADR